MPSLASMTDTTGDKTPASSVVDRVVASIPADMPDEQRALMEPFARMYLRRLPEVDLPDVTPDQLLAEICDLLEFVSIRPSGDSKIRVFKPQGEHCGYTTPGSVVQIVSDDRTFLVDSVTAAVSTADANVVRHLHPLIGTVRDDQGKLTSITKARGASRRESVQHFELDRGLTDEASATLEATICNTLEDISKVVTDFDPMRGIVETMIKTAKSSVHHYSFEEISETVAFLEWLLEDNFVFLGYRQYNIEDQGKGPSILADVSTGLGILRDPKSEPKAVPLADLPPHLQERYVAGDLMVISKTNRHSSVHRDARMDYVGVRRIGADGSMVAELRLLGLYTSKAYLGTASDIPVLRRKLSDILAAQDVIEGSHDYKAIVALFETFPKDELFAMDVEVIGETISELLETEEGQTTRLIVQRDTLNRSVSVLVSVARDRFNANLRMQLQEMFLDVFGGDAIDYRLALGESGDARMHFTVWTDEGARVDVDLSELEQRVVALSRNWHDRVIEELLGRVSDSEARRLADFWSDKFPDYYKDATGVDIAAGDVINVDRLSRLDTDVIVRLQNEQQDSNPPGVLDPLTRVTVYRSAGKFNLSEMMPHIENLGLTVVEEVPTRLSDEAGTFIHDFGVLTVGGEELDIELTGDRIGRAIEAALVGDIESDSLHRLLVSTDLDHEELMILRAYRSYWQLVTPSFSIGYVDNALATQPRIAEDLVRLFFVRLGSESDAATEEVIRDRILSALDDVDSLDEDRILRGFLGLILATERSNICVEGRQSLALKFRSDSVPEMPDPKPLYEIFVYARGVEGVHLRGGMVARGGIRWSDRMEDYRTEVLGLMKAQMTKNAVIVPTGAKGGFVIKMSAEGGRPTYEEVKKGYQVFIRGLLDVTDNFIDGAAVPPTDVVRHDGDDPYFVVAADKGTASFSDTANDIARGYGFWLDDAFASGGSAGYDHKALGITARGAWESVRRHFLDLGVNVDEDEITAVGIGDMSGDVFGNGMLMSKHLKLVAAFDHRHIFIDPNPEPEASWIERDRLAGLSRSSWLNYNTDVMSRGGGIFDRASKSVTLTPQIRLLLDTDIEELTPNALIRLVLKASVDLLWNGGIGTYVKARSESDDVVQDRSNDAVRVNGRDLRCRVIGEGGNLGCTQRGRVEYERRGGRVFADFIDNSGGVHASDREVNLKILLGISEAKGQISRSQRDEIIGSVAEDVVEFILYDNFLQAQIISQEAMSSHRRIEAYMDLMDRLEREGILDRELEFLPGNEEMAQRSREGKSMASPEIAVLLAYAKRSLTEHILQSSLPDDPHFESDLLEYFPSAIAERFADDIAVHPLRRELISTIVANQVLNSQGSTFYSRMRTVTGASAAMIVRAYRVARAVTGAQLRWTDIEALAGQIGSVVANRMMQDVDDLVSFVARWYLIHPNGRSIDEEIDAAADDFAALSDGFPDMPSVAWHEPYQAVVSEFEAAGVPHELAVRHAYQRALRRGPDIVDIAHRFEFDILEIASLSTEASQVFRIGWLERQVRRLPGTTAFDRLAIEAVRDDLQSLRRDVVSRVLEETGGSIDDFIASHERLMPRLARWHLWLTRDGIQDVSAAMIATRRLHQLLVGR
ncbi:MAG: NAD-glutamate dehydrogenase [Acidimicrobiia bacterium]|nr:MAG: NAD-glutamate dehydrogenase [Acidimicrobiia bacterium]